MVCRHPRGLLQSPGGARDPLRARRCLGRDQNVSHDQRREKGLVLIRKKTGRQLVVSLTEVHVDDVWNTGSKGFLIVDYLPCHATHPV